jgi:hypothetical protein
VVVSVLFMFLVYFTLFLSEDILVSFIYCSDFAAASSDSVERKDDFGILSNCLWIQAGSISCGNPRK